jgi:lipoprotein-anchoring transpeptidase ErfK/SrfK
MRLNMRNFRFLAILTLATVGASAANDPRKLVISLADHKLAVVEDGRAVKVYSIAVGKPSTPSPTGTFEIIERVANPTWYGPHQVVAPGPGNPLGTRWMGLSYKGYGIHGTNAPRSIGRSASHGCIRMRTQDVEELFELVHVGEQVELLDQATGELAKLFQTAPAPAKITLASNTHGSSAAANRTISGGRL